MSKEIKEIFKYILYFLAFWFGIYLMWKSAIPDRFEAGIVGFFFTFVAFYAALKHQYEKELKEKDETINVLLNTKNHHTRAKHT